VAILDSNCDPDGIDYPIPGNDDASRAIELYCDLISKAAIAGIEEGNISAGVDLGAAEEPGVEAVLEEAVEAPTEAAVEAVSDTPVEEVAGAPAAEEAPMDKVSAEEAPTDEAPTEEAPAEEPATPKEEASAQAE
ncbi:MAG: 30S ribosomal protein S2, partial [Pseudomonadota bacterium]|nr:30S ribosomal protein S2 [Pseudomonadota bacterium]